jgi:hypothetical protein
MVLIIIVCIIAWGVCRFKQVDFIRSLYCFINTNGKLSAYSKENAATTDFSIVKKLIKMLECDSGIYAKNMKKTINADLNLKILLERFLNLKILLEKVLTR